jgi:hypothetical protein
MLLEECFAPNRDDPIGAKLPQAYEVDQGQKHFCGECLSVWKGYHYRKHYWLFLIPKRDRDTLSKEGIQLRASPLTKAEK